MPELNATPGQTTSPTGGPDRGAAPRRLDRTTQRYGSSLSTLAREVLGSLRELVTFSPRPVPHCESCHTTEDLLPDEGAGIVFCVDCAAPVSEIAFPEFYLDLGNGD